MAGEVGWLVCASFVSNIDGARSILLVCVIGIEENKSLEFIAGLRNPLAQILRKCGFH
jgi:hypothetical protein